MVLDLHIQTLRFLVYVQVEFGRAQLFADSNKDAQNGNPPVLGNEWRDMCNNLGKEGMYIMIYCIMITLLPRRIITEALVMQLDRQTDIDK